MPLNQLKKCTNTTHFICRIKNVSLSVNLRAVIMLIVCFEYNIKIRNLYTTSIFSFFYIIKLKIKNSNVFYLFLKKAFLACQIFQL